MERVLEAGPNRFPRRVLLHWVTALLLTVSGVLTALTSIYFLVLTSGGYQGGRNPHYGQTFLFDRHVWSDVHTWAGVSFIALALFHVALHWNWLVKMTGRSVAIVRSERKLFSWGLWLRLGVVALIGLTFIFAAASGLYFFFAPSGGGRSARAVSFLFSRSTWDLVHTSAGVLMISAATVHAALRWTWVMRVTRSVGRSFVGRKNRVPEGAPGWSSAS